MPDGKPAGVACIQLDAQLRCRLFGLASRPRVCSSLQPHPTLCADSVDTALLGLALLEAATAPGPTGPPVDALRAPSSGIPPRDRLPGP